MIRAACVGVVGAVVLLVVPAQAGVGLWGPSHGPDGGLVSALAVDPQDTQTVYAGTPYGVYKSTDGGRSWAPSRQGLGAVGIGSLAVDPQASRIVYAAGGHKVFRSTNGGRSWRSFTRGLPSLAVRAITISGNGRVLYAGTAGGDVSDYKLP